MKPVSEDDDTQLERNVKYLLDLHVSTCIFCQTFLKSFMIKKETQLLLKITIGYIRCIVPTYCRAAEKTTADRDLIEKGDRAEQR